MSYMIKHLPRDKWSGAVVPIRYTTSEYYGVDVERKPDGFSINIARRGFISPVTHFPEEYDFPDKLYADYWPEACAWGIAENGKLLAVIETCPEGWSNRLRVTELWVDESLRGQGVGRALMDIAKEQARLERRRAVMLETQSCNVNAIGFYLHEGFSLIGMDTCCYSNRDIARCEVRLELGWFPAKRTKAVREELEIRPEQPEDWYAVELMTRNAFWNKFQSGCDEHFLVHKLRGAAEYLPELSRLAVADGRIVGAIYYSRAQVRGEAGSREVLTFGPLCVEPQWQGRGVGEALLRETIPLAAEAGWPGIVIFGEKDYYPRVGFTTCDNFGITTPDGNNSDTFMAIELKPGAMSGIRGKFYEASVFSELPPAEVERLSATMPPAEKRYFPAQWHAPAPELCY